MMRRVGLLALAAAAAAGQGRYNTKADVKEGVLNVHLVSHTHDDTGWLKTVDQDFEGTHQNVQKASVAFIIDTVVAELEQNPDRTFSYAEVAFFQRWWREQSNETRSRVRSLVKSGQLEFINGGWCMHDEASPHWLAMVDQTTLGHRYLKDEVGAIPTVGWQIDPFGHSATHAALISAGDGFDGLFFARIDFEERKVRRKHKSLEMVWRGSRSLGEAGDLFTGAFPSGGYGPPKGFNWDGNGNILDVLTGSGSPKIQDDPELDGYNVKSRIDDFVKVCQEQADVTRDNHIMLTMGSDYNYEAAHNWYGNMDKLVHHANLDGRLNVLYSTPSKYVAAKAQSKVRWPLKEDDDFFPYADRTASFWSGFFTSRPALKRYSRLNEGFMQMANQVLALGTKEAAQPKLQRLWEAVSLVQHHDAITGTEKQHVAFDYAKRLARGRAEASPHVASALAGLLGANDSSGWVQCLRANQSECEPTRLTGTGVGATRTVVLWNSLAQPRQQLVRIPVGGPGVRVLGAGGREVVSDVIDSQPVQPYGKKRSGAASLPYEVRFVAELPALGYASYRIVDETREKGQRSAADRVIQNDILKVTFGADGRISSIYNSRTKLNVPVRQEWAYYFADKDPVITSGAYLFSPNSTKPTSVNDGPVDVQIIQSAVGAEARMRWSDWLTQTVRLAPGQDFVEIEYTVGPVPVPESRQWPLNYFKQGKEVVSLFQTDIKNRGKVWTDSNGRDMLERTRDKRKYWHLPRTQPVSANYYPVSTTACITDSKVRLTVVTDAAQGAGSIRDGELELMAHRRLLVDDTRGVGEPLNETEGITSYDNCPYPLPAEPTLGCGRRLGEGLVVRGRYYLRADPLRESMRGVRPLMDRVFAEQAGSLGNAYFGPSDVPVGSKSFVSAPLPANVFLATLERLSEKSLLVRVSHQFGKSEDELLSRTARVDLSQVLSPMNLTVANVTEMTITANRPLSDVKRLHFKTSPWLAGPAEARTPDVQDRASSVVTLKAMQVRTFVVDTH